MNDRADSITGFNNPDMDSLITEVKFTRRSFIASSIATGFALSAGPAVAQTAIITQSQITGRGGRARHGM